MAKGHTTKDLTERHAPMLSLEPFTSVTADSSPLYTYVGYKPTPDMEKTLIHGNSAFQCHLQCYDDNTVGLRVSSFTITYSLVIVSKIRML